MLLNISVTAFIVSELLRENQQGVKHPLLPPRLRLTEKMFAEKLFTKKALITPPPPPISFRDREKDILFINF